MNTALHTLLNQSQRLLGLTLGIGAHSKYLIYRVRNATFSIWDHLSSTSLAKLKYSGTSCSQRLIAS